MQGMHDSDSGCGNICFQGLSGIRHFEWKYILFAIEMGARVKEEEKLTQKEEELQWRQAEPKLRGTKAR